MNSNIDGSAIINKFLEADNLTDEQMEDMLTLAELFADMSESNKLLIQQQNSKLYVADFLGEMSKLTAETEKKNQRKSPDQHDHPDQPN